MFNSEEPPTLAMMTTFANFPLITLALIGWGIARGSAAVAGEIERGALDLTLSRPVYRSTWLAAQIVSTLVVFLALAMAMIAAHTVAQYFYPYKNPPGVAAFLPSVLMVVGFGMATYALTLVFSSGDLSRVRVGILGLGITLGGIAGLFFARQYDDYPWLERFSVYHYYWPVGIVVSWTEEITRNLGYLYGTFGVGALIAFLVFTRRDLPTSGG
jgi:ABC-2 type transport system permease protein